MTHRDVEPSPIDLTPLKNAGADPVFDPSREQALLAAFDAAWTDAPRRATGRARAWQPFAVAAVLVLAASVAWTIALRRPGVHTPDAPAPRGVVAAPPAAAPTVKPVAHAIPAPRARKPPQRANASAFVPWPGADTLPAFESGHLLRLDLPTSVAISLGLEPPASQASVVRADILVGQDGLARAVRVAP